METRLGFVGINGYINIAALDVDCCVAIYQCLPPTVMLYVVFYRGRNHILV